MTILKIEFHRIGNEDNLVPMYAMELAAKQAVVVGENGFPEFPFGPQVQQWKHGQVIDENLLIELTDGVSIEFFGNGGFQFKYDIDKRKELIFPLEAFMQILIFSLKYFYRYLAIVGINDGKYKSNLVLENAKAISIPLNMKIFKLLVANSKIDDKDFCQYESKIFDISDLRIDDVNHDPADEFFPKITPEIIAKDLVCKLAFDIKGTSMLPGTNGGRQRVSLNPAQILPFKEWRDV